MSQELSRLDRSSSLPVQPPSLSTSIAFDSANISGESQTQRNANITNEAFDCLLNEDISAISDSTPSSANSVESQSSQSHDTDFLCSFCDRRFKTKIGRNEHEKRHDTDRSPQHLCVEPNCGKRLMSKNHLRRHIQSVSLVPFGSRSFLLMPAGP